MISWLRTSVAQAALACVLLLALPINGIVCAVRATEPPIVDVAFTPDGRQLLAASQRGLTVHAWPTLEVERSVSLPFDNVHRLQFSMDGKALAVGGGVPGEFGEVHIVKWPELDSVAFSREHDDSVSSLCWVDEHTVASASFDRQVLVWNVKENRVLQRLDGHSRAVRAVSHLEKEQLLVTAGNDLSLRVWAGVADGKGTLKRNLNQHTQEVFSLAIGPPAGGPTLIASSADDRTVRFWQPTIGRFVRYAKLDSAALDLVWLDSQRVAACCKDGKVRVIDSLSIEVLETLDGIPGWAYALAKHPDDNRLVVAGTNGQLKRIEIPNLAVP